MKKLKPAIAATLIAAFVASPFAGLAADQKTDQKAKAKPYPLKTCVVSGEKLGDMGDGYTFVRDGQEVKLCCKDCLKDFDKNQAKYMKKIKEAEAKPKK